MDGNDRTDSMNGRTYPIKYKVTLGEWKRDMKDEGSLATSDAIVFIPIVRGTPDDPMCLDKELGCYTVDGHTIDPIEDHELFQVFIFLASTLLKSAVLQRWQLAILSKVIEDMQKLRGIVGLEQEIPKRVKIVDKSVLSSDDDNN